MSAHFSGPDGQSPRAAKRQRRRPGGQHQVARKLLVEQLEDRRLLSLGAMLPVADWGLVQPLGPLPPYVGSQTSPRAFWIDASRLGGQDAPSDLVPTALGGKFTVRDLANSTPITISSSGAASPYPSTLSVSGLPSSVTDVNVTLNGFTHTWPDDVDVLLVGPAGQRVILMSDVGGGSAVSELNLTLDDAAYASLPDNDPLTSGTFRPTNIGTGDSFPAPAPASPYDATLASFNGTDPNGTWSLFVYDDADGDSGSFSGGWSLAVTASGAPTDTIGPRVISSSVQANDVRAAGTLTYTAQFDEPLKTAELEKTDIQLVGQMSGAMAASTFAYDDATQTVTAQFAGLGDDLYTLKLLSGDGRFEDAAGNDLDGEATTWPIPPNPSGNGTPGGDFAVSFEVDLTTAAFPTPLESLDPAGSLIYRSTAVSGVLARSSDTDVFTVSVDAGQRISVLAEASGGLDLALELRNPSGVIVATANAMGVDQDEVILSVGPTVAGVYTVTVSGAASTTGGYQVTLLLNAAVELESHQGPGNDDLATAQDLSGAFVALGGTTERAAVVGTSDRTPAPVPPHDWYRFNLGAGETATLTLAALGPGPLDLVLSDANGASLARGVAAPNVAQIISNFVAPVAAAYYAEVEGTGGDYSLVVIRNAAFDAEPNNDFAGAQEISQSEGVLGHVKNAPPGLSPAFNLPRGGIAPFVGPTVADYNLAPIASVVLPYTVAAAYDEGIAPSRQVPATDSGSESPTAPAEAASSLIPIIDQFPGPGTTGFIPPDPIAAAGPEQIVTFVNCDIAIYDKASGAQSYRDTSANFFSSVGSTTYIFDPWVLFDTASQRFFLMGIDVASDTQSNVFLAVSTDATPTGAADWSKYKIDFTHDGSGGLGSGAHFPDYPKLGVNQDAVWIAGNYFPIASGSGEYAGITAIGKASLLTGGPAIKVYEEYFNGFSVFPMTQYGPSPVEYFAEASTGSGSAVMIHAVTNVLTSPTRTTTTLTVPPYQFPDDVPQLGGGAPADSIDARIMTGVWQNGSMWFAHAVKDPAIGDGEAVARWYEVATNNFPAGTPTLVQSGDVDPGPGVRAWMPAIAVDASDNMGIGFSIGGPTQYFGAGFTGRLAGDPAGTTIFPVTTYASGLASYEALDGSGRNRWGDYSGLAIDPADLATFWAFNEYATATPNTWATEVASFVLQEPIDDDWFAFAVNVGDTMTLRTSTPADGANAFVNALDPRIALYAPDGSLVAADDNSAPDGRNALLTRAAAQAGSYRVRVSAVNSLGEYFLSVDTSSALPGPSPAVVDMDPDDGQIVPVFPTTVTLDFSESILLSSVQAVDVLIGGLPAIGFTVADGDTIRFQVDPAANAGDTTYRVQLAAGAVADLHGRPNAAFAASFMLDGTGPRIMATTWNGGALPGDRVLTEGPLTFTARLNEDLYVVGSARRGPFTPAADDIQLVDTITGTAYAPATVSYDPATALFTAGYAALPEGRYLLTLLSGNGSFEDMVGNDLDGEPLGPDIDGTPSGNGVAGGDYVVSFSVDRLAPIAARPFTRFEPFGSLMSMSGANTGLINRPSDEDDFTFFVAAGETILVTAAPHDPAATLSIQVPGLTGVFPATAPGGTAILPLHPIAADGVYTLRVTSDLSTTFTLEINKNFDQELTDTDASHVLPFDATRVALSPGRRYAVVGSSTPTIPPPPPSAPFRLLGGTGSAKPNAFSLVELQTNPVAEVLIGAASYNPGLDRDPTTGLLYGASSSLLDVIVPDVDDYSLDLTASVGHAVDIVLTGLQGVDFSGQTFELVDPNGVVVATASPAPLGVDSANYDLGILDFSVADPGVYVLQVTSRRAGDYSLVLIDRLAFDSEPNDTLSDPLRSLNGVDGAMGYLNSSTSKFDRGVAGVERSEPPVGGISGGSLRSTPATHGLGTANLEVLNSQFLTAFTDRASFDAAYPGLPIEDFEEAAVASGTVRGEEGFAAADSNRAESCQALAELRQVAASPEKYTQPFYLPPQKQLIRYDGFLSGPSPQADPLTVAMDFLTAHAPELGLQAQDLTDVMVMDQYVTSPWGVTHIYLRQTYSGLEVANADINVNVTADGQVINVGSSFVPGLGAGYNQDRYGAKPAWSAVRALSVLADQFGWRTIQAEPAVLSAAQGTEQSQVLASSGVSLADIPAKLHYVPTSDGGVELAWQLIVQTVDGNHWYDASVSAADGDVLNLSDWVDQASYNVFPVPVESPSYGPRSIQVNPNDLVASPYGWHDTDGVSGAEFTDTRGNNLSAQEDRDDNDTGGYRPSGGSSLDFDFPLDLSQSPTVYQDTSITNLFYWNNILHDVHYQYGFTEAAGNFQVNNYGRGGLGNDAVQADAQDGSGTDNANFATPPDGSAPRMQQFIFTLTTPNRDSSLDNGIIVHEYGHGVSNRLTGGPANADALDALQSRALGEGWSDWWALMFTQVAGDQATDAYPMGTYAMGQDPVTGAGIRRHPYSFDMEINPLTFSDFNTSNEVHDAGEIWAAALWDLNWLLIRGNMLDPALPAGLGFDPDLYHYHGTGGNNLALQLIMDGLKLQPANPSFLDGRDAILLADRVNYGGAHQLAIWKAFARRGLGYSASDGDSAYATTVTAAFDLPASSRGAVELDRESYQVGDTVSIRLCDSDLVGHGPVFLDVVTNRGDVETVTLAELGAGVFAGSISTASSAVNPGSGVLEVAVGDRLTVTYHDADDGSGSPAVVRDQATMVTLVNVFNVDFSDPAGAPFDEGFRLSESANEWHLSTGRGNQAGHTADDSFYFGTGEGPSGGGVYANNAQGTLTSPVIDLRGYLGAQLSFNHFLQTETGYDFATVQIRTSAGTTLLATSGAELPVATSGFEHVTLDLAAFEGQSIQVEFGFTSDFGITREGWYVDDVTVWGGITDPALMGPTVVGIDPSGTVVNQPISQVVVAFSEPITAVSATDPANYEFVEAGSDNVLGTADDVSIPLTLSFNGTDSITLLVGAPFAPLAAGTYQLTIDGDSSIEDMDGNPLNSVTGPGGGSDHVHPFHVAIELPSHGDLYTLDLAAGQTVSIWTEIPFEAPAGSPVNDLDPQLFVYSAAGFQLAADQNSRDRKNAQIEFTAPAAGTYLVQVVGESGEGEYLLRVAAQVKFGEVVDRWVFYNNSYFDGNNVAADVNDFNAIAPHTSKQGGHGPHRVTGVEETTKELGKDALLPGQTATFVNYTNFSKGLNGIMVDIAGLAGTPTLADFQFKVGNTNDPTTWAIAPAPAQKPTVFAGQGTPDAMGVASDRVALIWADKVIQKTWLQVTVLATANTGLAQPDVFYFGNAPGESGARNTATYAFVTVTDELAARNHPHNIAGPALVTDPYDYSKDSFVTVTDELLARNNATNITNALRLIVAPALPSGAAWQTTFALPGGPLDAAAPLTQPTGRSTRDVTPASDASPLSPALSPAYRGEGVMSATAAPLTPTLSPEYRGEGAIAASAARDQLFTQLARGVRGTARSQAMPWARWEESVSLLSAENESLVSDAELQLLDDLFAKY